MSENKTPNIVLILTDTQAINIIGAYGHPDMLTPNIDRLANRGIKFERAYCACPVCTPARAALFTGIYPHTSGPWTNNLPLGMNIKTMGQFFQDNGYHTVYTGKWHLDGHDYFGTGICPPGWDETYWYDGANYLAELSEVEIRMWRQELNDLKALQQANIKAEFTWAHRVSNRAIDFLKQRDAAPFLLVVSYDEPHHPFTCPPEYAEKFIDFDYDLGPSAFDTLENKPAHQREWAEWSMYPVNNGKIRHPLYFGCNSFVDHEIGRVIETVHQYSPENTFIVFTSDHGEMLGSHRLFTKGPVMYEYITHIPLIIEQPDGVGAGTTNPTLVSHIDLLPTMLDLAGIHPPPNLEGQNIAPLLSGEQNLKKAIELEFLRYEIEHDSWGGFQPVRCILSDIMKLVINLHYTDELYNMADDPHELINLIDDPDYAQIRNDLHDRLLDWMNEKRDPFRGPIWERRPWRTSLRLSWRGMYRPRPEDGYSPPVKDYDTGQPTRGIKEEYR